ncbi:hypothetical protein [Ruania alba]|uniref:DUF308 domain-containing protein n=1 Tax=Ruania alba TaxID=648782 RepID=A0A1H5FH17_9MICO|nr:hypothetical protein [Ruania alba]SEE02681.1 hypothetical protein SAMN04488554_1338 [Ruania alba]
MPPGTPDDSDSPTDRPEPSDADVDARWAEITAQLGELRAPTDSPGPAEPSDEHGTLAGADRPAGGVPAAPSGPRDYEVPDDADEAGFIPPDPPPLRATDPLPTVAWFFALGGPILTVLFLIVWPAAPPVVYLTAILASIAGWLILLWRMPRGRRDDSDDGAVV